MSKYILSIVSLLTFILVINFGNVIDTVYAIASNISDSATIAKAANDTAAKTANDTAAKTANDTAAKTANDTAAKAATHSIPTRTNTITIIDLQKIFDDINPEDHYSIHHWNKPNGTLEQIPNELTKWSYNSHRNFTGIDTFQLINNNNKTKLYNITMFVQGYNPTIIDDSIPTRTNTITIIDLQKISNDIHPNEHFFVKLKAANGELESLPDQETKWSYKSLPNFTGIDTFQLINNDKTKLYNITMIVQPGLHFKPILDISQDDRFRISMIVSLFAVLAIFLAVWKILRNYKYTGKYPYKPRFSDIIRSSDWYPSLPLFQFILWTGMVIFTYLAVYLFRIFNGVFDPPQEGIPINVLAIMGISIGVPIISNYVSSTKRGPGLLTDVPPPEPRPSFSTMLYEFGKPTLSRFQMFAWTWISLFIYFLSFVPAVTHNFPDPQNANIPNIDPTLVALMGLSQFAFLAGKASNPKLQISSIFPEVGRIGEKISIFGSNFGNKSDIIWFNDRAIKTKELVEDVYWSESGERVDLKIPEDIKPGEYNIRVSNGGYISEPFRPPYTVLPKNNQEQQKEVGKTTSTNSSGEVKARNNEIP